MKYLKHHKDSRIIIKVDDNGDGEIINSSPSNMSYIPGDKINKWCPFALKWSIQEYFRPLETIEDWLKTLPSPYKELALKRREEKPDRYTKAENFGNALNWAFEWCKTEEGYYFWLSVYDAVRTKSPWPKIPETITNKLDTNMKLPEKFFIETPTAGIVEDVRARLEELGYKWGVSDTTPKEILVRNNIVDKCSYTPYWFKEGKNCHYYTEVTISELFHPAIAKVVPPAPPLIIPAGEFLTRYDVVVDKTKGTYKIGCQEGTTDGLKQAAKKILQYLE